MTHVRDHWEVNDTDAERTQVLPTSSPPRETEPTRELPSFPADPDPEAAQEWWHTLWEFESERTQELPSVREPEVERTRELPSVREPEVERTKELPTFATPVPAAPVPPVPVAPPVTVPTRGPVQVPPAASRPGEARTTDAWAYQMARQRNKVSTDIGLLLLRWLSLPLALHGVGHAFAYPALAERIAQTPLGGHAPAEALAVAIIACQVSLPLFLAVGALTRISAALQAAMMIGVYAFLVLPGTGVIDGGTGALAGEAVLAYAALALPLVFTGAGRVSIDHALTSGRRERLATKRLAKAARRRGEAPLAAGI